MNSQIQRNLLAWFLLTNLLSLGIRGEGQSRPVVGKPAPLFTMNDVEEKSHSLKDLRGKPVVVLFFCPCEYCKPVAALWAEAQRGGALVPEPGKDVPAGLEPPKTLVIFAGEPDLTREFGEVAGFEKEITTLLPDPKLRTARLYDAIPCPRAFVVDGKGNLRYTNNEAGRMPHKIPAPTLVSRLLSAVHNVLLGKPVSGEKPRGNPKPSRKNNKSGKKGAGRATR